LNRNFSRSYEQLIYNWSKKSIIDNFINNHYFLYLFLYFIYFLICLFIIYFTIIYCEIFYMTDQQKIFLWKYFKFIRLLIKIGSRWSIIDHFFCDQQSIKKVKYCYLNLSHKKFYLYRRINLSFDSTIILQN
jgi:hypothetical protein